MDVMGVEFGLLSDDDDEGDATGHDSADKMNPMGIGAGTSATAEQGNSSHFSAFQDPWR